MVLVSEGSRHRESTVCVSGKVVIEDIQGWICCGSILSFYITLFWIGKCMMMSLKQKKRKEKYSRTSRSSHLPSVSSIRKTKTFPNQSLQLEPLVRPKGVTSFNVLFYYMATIAHAL